MKRFLKWTAISLVSIVAVLLVVIYGASEYKLRRKFDIAAAPIAVPTDSAGLARGRHIFETRGCEGCHGAGLAGSESVPLSGSVRRYAMSAPRSASLR